MMCVYVNEHIGILIEHSQICPCSSTPTDSHLSVVGIETKKNMAGFPSTAAKRQPNISLKIFNEHKPNIVRKIMHMKHQVHSKRVCCGILNGTLAVL